MAIGFGATATGDATTARNVAPSYGTVDEGQVKTYQFGNSQSGPYYRLNGIPAGSTTIATLAVPTAWPR